MGVSFNEFVHQVVNADDVMVVVGQKAKDIKDNGYVIALMSGAIIIAIHNSATAIDHMKAYFHAIVLRKIIEMDKSLG